MAKLTQKLCYFTNGDSNLARATKTSKKLLSISTKKIFAEEKKQVTWWPQKKIQAEQGKMTTSLEIPILHWTCTFYDEKERKWKEGELQLNQTQIAIVYEDNRDKSKKAKVIKFVNISKIAKEKSSYIYPSIVVHLMNCVVWLSSFKSRDEVFNNIEHFWRISLLDSRASKRYNIKFQKHKHRRREVRY